MKDFLQEVLFDTFTGGAYFIDYCVGVFSWIVVLAISACIIWFSIWLIDSSFMPTKEGTGIVIEKHFVPEHFETTYIKIGSILSPIESFVEANYSVSVRIDNLTDDIQICESDYFSIKKDSRVWCTYTNGRIRNSLYIKHIKI